MMMNMNVIQRLHEQREFPDKRVINLNLQKGVMVETLLWNEKTENVDIKERIVLNDFKWSMEGKYEFLDMEFEKINLEEYNKAVSEIVKQIMKKHFDALKYSFMKGMIERAERMVETGCLVVKDIRRMENYDKKKNGKGTQKVPQN